MSDTELVHDRTLLDALFDRTSAPMLLADDQRRYVEVNRAGCDLLGVPREKILEMRIDDLASPELRGRTEEMFAAFLEEGSQAGPYRLKLPDGREVDVLYSATANVIPGVHLSVFMLPDGADSEGDLTASEEANADEREGLNVREREVLGLLALGDSYPEIAEKLHLSPETVRNYTRSARAKLGARSRAHAITLALQSGQLKL